MIIIVETTVDTKIEDDSVMLISPDGIHRSEVTFILKKIYEKLHRNAENRIKAF